MDICIVSTLAIVHDVFMSINVQIFVWTCLFISLEYIPRSVIAGSYGNFNFLRNLQTIFQDDRIILYPHQ